MQTLLAKSGVNPPTLERHTRDVVDAAESLFGAWTEPTRLGREWLRFFRLGPADAPQFLANLLAAALFHDWGKANSDMQFVFLGKGNGQLIRHEHLSVLLLGYDGVDRWVRQRTDIDWDVVLAAVGSHHLKFSDAAFAEEKSDTPPVRVYLDHPDFRDKIIPLTAQRLGLNGSPTLPKQSYWGFVEEPATFDPTDLRDRLRNKRLRVISTTTDQQMLRAVRAALIAADAAGSGLPRTGRQIDWIRGQFDETELCDHATIQGVIDSRVADLTARGKWAKWSTFQDDCAALPPRALLLAPCGAGKTLAAWRWIAARVAERPAKRVLFLYPTRATATEGFKDYVSWAPEAAAALLHGTAGYDLDGMFPADDDRAKKRYDATDPRLFALQHWSKRVVSATVDQFFGFMAYAYGPMCLLPLLADSVIVVDEVHSFDKAMFSSLLGFLTEFDVPVLCMTATLQKGRFEQLRKLMGGVYGPENYPADLLDTAGGPRYRVARIGEGEAEQRVRDAIADGKRVLWVVNQVSRAQAVAAKLADLGAICYHSRFKLDDRVEGHRETVATIRAGMPAAVAVATQVCEMSLDIDADLLVTEECPITSLVQRMGRCRRGRDELEKKGPGEVLVYKPAEEKVYSPDMLNGLDTFLDFVTGKAAVSQTDLEVGMEKFGAAGADAPKLNSFLTSGPFALAGEDSFRDIEAFNVQAVLAGDVEKFLDKNTPSHEKPGFVLPVPRKHGRLDPRLPNYLRVADESHYDPRTGFWDTPLR